MQQPGNNQNFMINQQQQQPIPPPSQTQQQLTAQQQMMMQQQQQQQQQQQMILQQQQQQQVPNQQQQMGGMSMQPGQMAQNQAKPVVNPAPKMAFNQPVATGNPQIVQQQQQPPQQYVPAQPPTGQPDDEAYNRKIQDVKRFLPLLDTMLKNANEKGTDSTKIKAFIDVVIGTKRVSMETLLKCEKTLIVSPLLFGQVVLLLDPTVKILTVRCVFVPA